MLYRFLILVTVATAVVAFVWQSVPAVLAAGTLGVFAGLARGIDL